MLPHLYMYTHTPDEPLIPKHLQFWFLVFCFPVFWLPGITSYPHLNLLLAYLSMKAPPGSSSVPSLQPHMLLSSFLDSFPATLACLISLKHNKHILTFGPFVLAIPFAQNVFPQIAILAVFPLAFNTFYIFFSPLFFITTYNNVLLIFSCLLSISSPNILHEDKSFYMFCLLVNV